MLYSTLNVINKLLQYTNYYKKILNPFFCINFLFWRLIYIKINQILKNLAKNPDSQQLTETNRNFPKFPEFVSRNIFESRFVSGK